jgi:hypothetical protein
MPYQWNDAPWPKAPEEWQTGLQVAVRMDGALTPAEAERRTAAEAEMGLPSTADVTADGYSVATDYDDDLPAAWAAKMLWPLLTKTKAVRHELDVVEVRLSFGFTVSTDAAQKLGAEDRSPLFRWLRQEREEHEGDVLGVLRGSRSTRDDDNRGGARVLWHVSQQTCLTDPIHSFFDVEIETTAAIQLVPGETRANIRMDWMARRAFWRARALAYTLIPEEARTLIREDIAAATEDDGE